MKARAESPSLNCPAPSCQHRIFIDIPHCPDSREGNESSTRADETLNMNFRSSSRHLIVRHGVVSASSCPASSSRHRVVRHRVVMHRSAMKFVINRRRLSYRVQTIAFLFGGAQKRGIVGLPWARKRLATPLVRTPLRETHVLICTRYRLGQASRFSRVLLEPILLQLTSHSST